MFTFNKVEGMSVKYQSLIREAKRLLEVVECHQAAIAKIAIAAKEEKDPEGKHYTLAVISRDMGVSYKTLHKWTYIYENICTRIDLPSPSKREWSAASMANDLLGQGKQNRPTKKKLQRVYKTIRKGDARETIFMVRQIKNLHHLRDRLSDLEVGDVERQLLSTLAVELSKTFAVARQVVGDGEVSIL